MGGLSGFVSGRIYSTPCIRHDGEFHVAETTGVQPSLRNGFLFFLYVEPPNDPAHRILILFERPGRPAQFVAEEVRHEFADRRLPFEFRRTGRA